MPGMRDDACSGPGCASPPRRAPLTLAYPRWLPGTHGPTGDITSVVGLEFRAAGAVLPWRRDPVEMHAFHLDVPAGADAVEVSLEFLSAIPGAGFTQAVSFTPHLGMFRWHEVLLYPAEADTGRLQVAASLRLPAGWRYATALPGGDDASAAGDVPVRFRPVSLDTLVDSPVLMGRHLKIFPLAEGPRPVDMAVAADSPEALAVPDSSLDFLRRLVVETDAVFGTRHFDRYRFLVALSDSISHFGLEHHESSQNRMPERSFTNPVLSRLWLDLLAHEYAHSWVGKYRRPVGLATRGYLEPMAGELLWVYEGLTQYLANILSARSGLWTEERYRDQLAQAVAWYQVQPGRSWRPLADTAVAAQRFGSAPAAWSSYRRALDYYNEGWLLWMEVDFRLRQASGGRRSLDDFLRSFAGPPPAPRQVRTFTAADIHEQLTAIADADWPAFFRERLETTGSPLPLAGLETGGWSLHFDGETNQHIGDLAAGNEPRVTDLSFSLGLRLLPDGTVQDVLRGSPAERAGLTPGRKLLAVNGRRYSAERLREAVIAAAAGSSLDFITENGEFYDSLSVEYRDGLREPHLRRLPGRQDWLSPQVAPRVPPRGR
jgi:predicted metalloprotease with PDZ domain